MAMGYVAPLGKFIAFTNVAPGALVGGKVYTYESGTDVPTPTWADHTLTVENSNPVLLDSAGRASIYIADNTVMVYKFVVKDKNDVVVYTEDGISVPVVSTTVSGPGDTFITSSVPPGTILLYGGQSAPTGQHADPISTAMIDDYILCDGRAIDRTAYSTLRNVLGFSYGVGDNSSTFNVPDLRQRFPIGLAVAGPAATRGAVGGEFDHRHSGTSHVHSIPAHRHSTGSHTHGVSRAGWGSQPHGPAGSGYPPIEPGWMQTGAHPANPNASEQVVTQASQDTTTTGPSVGETDDKAAFATDPAGEGLSGAANPPYQVVNYIIRT